MKKEIVKRVRGINARNRVLAVKVSKPELVAWRKKAKAAGMTLSMWLLAPRRAEMERGR